MGAASSHDDSTSEMSDVIGREYGFRVHRVEPGSPGEAAGLTSILDYIVVANGVRLDHDDGTFVRMITESKGAPMKLCVFNTHTLTTRETMLTPNDEWGGNGLLGITIRFDVTQDLSKHTLHVLDVFENSPASAAALDAYNDYILGVGDLLYDGPDEFGEIVMHNERRPVRLYVYSVRTETVRDVMITPDATWGGDGCLGCGVGAGYLHAMPRRRDMHVRNSFERGKPSVESTRQKDKSIVEAPDVIERDAQPTDFTMASASAMSQSQSLADPQVADEPSTGSDLPIQLDNRT